MVVIFHCVARTKKMAAPIVEEEGQVALCDQMQCAAQCPCFDGGGAQDILIRRFPAAETQRVQAVAVKLRLQAAETAQHGELVRCGGKKILPVHAEQKHVVDLHGTPPFGANFPAGILAKNAVF